MININDKLNKSQAKSAKKLAAKFKKLESHPNYPALERFAQKCINDLTGPDATAAIADIHMEIINDMSDAELRAWADQYNEEDVA